MNRAEILADFASYRVPGDPWFGSWHGLRIHTRDRLEGFDIDSPAEMDAERVRLEHEAAQRRRVEVDRVARVNRQAERARERRAGRMAARSGCPVCGAPPALNRLGAPAIYCGAACRAQAHHEARVAAGRCSCGEPVIPGQTWCLGCRAARVRGTGTPRGEQHKMAKATAEKVAALRADYAAGVRITDLARRYGVSRAQVRRTLMGENWEGPTMLVPTTSCVEKCGRDRDGARKRCAECHAAHRRALGAECQRRYRQKRAGEMREAA